MVTGTRVASRSRLDSLAPVDVISAESLNTQATTELAEALSNTAPSLNFPRPSITDGTDHIRPATLRGLAPDQTLVLVNSKRRHQSALVNVNGSIGRGSAAVDLNAIPLAAIESVEVLRDGASAQYGSDAIAGVINLRLREAREGGNASITYGEYNTDVETERGQRKETDGATMTASGWVGLPLGEEGFLTLSGEYRDRDPTSRGDFDNRVPGSPVTSRYGDANVEDITAYVNAGVPLDGDWNIYGWAVTSSAKATPPRSRASSTSPQRAGYLPERLPAADHHRHRRPRAGLGRARQLGGWDTDVSLVYGVNEIAYGVEDSLNTSYGAASQTDFDAGGMKYDQIVFNAGMVRGFDWGLAEARKPGLRRGSAPRRVTASRPASPRRTTAVRSSAWPPAPRASRGFSPATNSTKTGRRTASTWTSKRRSPNDSSHRSRCAARTIRTSAAR